MKCAQTRRPWRCASAASAADQLGRQVGIDFERGGAGAAGAGDGERDVGPRVDRLRPGRLAGPVAEADRRGARIGEEARPGDQRGIEQVGRRDLAGAGGAVQLGDRAQIVGHDPGRGDAAIEVAPHQRLGAAAVGRRRHMLVAVDQAGEQIAAGKIDDPRIADHRRREPRGGQHRLDPRAIGDHRHVRLGRAAGAVDQCRAAIDDALARMRRRERRIGRGRAREGQHAEGQETSRIPLMPEA